MTAAFLKLPIKRPFVITLRNGLAFEARSGLDVWVIKESCLDRDYEQHSVPIQNGWTVVDIGAGLGDFAIHAARETPAGRVFAYEPAPGSFALLQRNLARNGVANVEAFQRAINGTGEPMVVDTSSGEGSLYRTSSTAGGGVEVAATTLDRALDELGLERCDFLKIDCEGGEYEILFHAADATLGRLRHVCLEYHEGVTQYNRHDLERFFERHSFVVRHQPNPVHAETGFMYAHRHE